jgi:hypothetical protein
MLQKALFALLFLGVSVGLAYYVYPTHPVVIWSLLAVCWICFRLGLRAQRMFRDHGANRKPSSPHHSSSWINR